MLRQSSKLPQQQSASAAAHGLTGILHTLALAHKEFPIESIHAEMNIAALIRSGTLALVNHAFPSGNLPSSHGSDDDK